MSLRLNKLSRDSLLTKSTSIESNDATKSKEILPTVKIRNRLNSGSGSITNIYIPYVQEDLNAGNDNDDMSTNSSVESGFAVVSDLGY